MIHCGPTTDGLIVERERGEDEWVCGGRGNLKNRRPGPRQNLEQDVTALFRESCQKRGRTSPKVSRILLIVSVLSSILSSGCFLSPWLCLLSLHRFTSSRILRAVPPGPS